MELPIARFTTQTQGCTRIDLNTGVWCWLVGLLFDVVGWVGVGWVVGFGLNAGERETRLACVCDMPVILATCHERDTTLAQHAHCVK